jgi:hypothetical protein
MSIDWSKESTKMKELYVRRCWPLRRIAAKYGVTAPTVAKYLSRWGVSRRDGDSRRHRRQSDHTGARFEDLTVVKRHPVLYPTRWLVRCVCGAHMVLSERQLHTKKNCVHGGTTCD